MRPRIARSAGRRRGEVDTTDVWVGVGLAVAIPLLVAFGLAAVGLPLTPRVTFDPRSEPNPAPPPLSDEELVEVYDLHEKILQENALFFLNRWRNAGDIERAYEREWTQRNLAECRSGFQEIIAYFNNTRNPPPNVVPLLGMAQQKLQEIEKYTDEIERGTVIK